MRRVATDPPSPDFGSSPTFPTDTTAGGDAPSTPQPSLHSWVGRRLGPYRIQKLLGRGGMGAVFLANRDDDEFRKQVALKLLRFETDDPAVLARFRNERQILATLDHPNIAGLYDGGSTDDGLPYIVMEYVPGRHLLHYCESKKLSVPARLRLFRQICDAVQYAHQRLIVHRDLKPTNILVTETGVPKLLDFGIAKLLLAPELLGDAVVHTQTGIFVMTPDYASPEQIRGESVSTASDVYSLGAVLYEMLAGQRPHTLTRYDAAEMQRKICESDPKPPSSAGGAAWRGDLDTIVLKALQRDPARRYGSVEQFSEDIRRYLENRPVHARPDTFFYRVSRFSVRNRWSIVAAAAVVLSLAAGTAVSLYQANVARQRFQQVRKLAASFLELHDDVARLPGSTAVREKMVATALDYLDNLSRSAGKDSDLLNELGVAYAKVARVQGMPGQPNLGRTDDALRNYGKAIDLERRASAINPAYLSELAGAQSELAYLCMLSGHLPEARKNLEESAALLARLRAAKPDDAQLFKVAASVAVHQGDLAGYEGNSAAALPFYQQALALSTDYARLTPGNFGRARQHLASTLVASSLAENKKYDEALATLRDSEPIIDALLAAEPDNPVYIRQKMTSANYQSGIYDNEMGEGLGKPVDAVAAGRQYIAMAQRLVDADPKNASARLSLAIAYFQTSYPLSKIDPAEALSMGQRSLKILDDDLALNPKDRLLRSRRARALRHLAYVLERAHRPTEARQAAEQAIQIQRQLLVESPNDGNERDQLETSQKALADLSKR
jgi:eukaryotic-like serine/threonine-protein kinase